jgi:hypothetical protein
MGNKVTCLKCSRVFDSEIEYRIHYSHNHPGPVMWARMESPRVIAVAEELKADEEAPYSLAASREGLGELSPVLKDVDGNVIDGFHRLGENAAWHTITVSTIDTPVKLELARLAVNFNRRKVSPEELSQRITFLVKSGLRPEEIAKQTGISIRTVQRYTPQELKNHKKVEAGQTPKTIEVSADSCQHTVTIPESIPATTGDFTPYVTAVPRVRTFAEAAAEAAQATAKAAESSFSHGEVEEDEVVPDGTPICPCCSASLNLSEYEEIKQKIKVKFGKSIQTLLFPEEEVS